jgi:hypothetical protein
LRALLTRLLAFLGLEGRRHAGALCLSGFPLLEDVDLDWVIIRCR